MWRMLLCVVIAAGEVWAQCDDVFDNILCAYALTPAEAAQFSRTDSVLSGFWEAWGGRDSIAETPPDYCDPDHACTPSSPDDAKLVVKAAATRYALYLYVEVTDDVFIDHGPSENWGADAIDLFFDQLSADGIMTCELCLTGLYATSITYTTAQYQIWTMSDDSLALGCKYQPFGEWTWQTQDLTWDAMEALYGISAQPVGLSPHRRAYEWRIPWVSYTDGLAAGDDLAGRRLAFCAGYSDMDSVGDTVMALRWLGRDPWADDALETNYWGDILLPAGLGTVDTLGSASVRSSPAAAPSMEAARAVGYDLLGRVLGRGSPMAQGVTLRRTGAVGETRMVVGLR